MKKFKLLSVFLCSMAVTLSSCVVANPVTTRTLPPTTSKTSGSGSTTQPQAAVLTSITVSDVVTSYEIASQFVKPVVTAHYSDKSSKNVTEKAKFSGFDLSKAGKQTVNVEYTENAVKKTVSYGIEVSIFGWEEGIASRMREALDDSVLPYIAGLWSIYYEPENYYVQIYSSSYSVAEICAVLETAGLTKEKTQVYSYPTTHGTVTLQVWTTQGYGIIDANYERAFLSDWTSEDKAVMQTYLYDLILKHPEGLWGEVMCANDVDVTTHTKDKLTAESVAKTYSKNGYLVLLDQQGGYVFTKTAPSKEGETTMYVNGRIFVDSTTKYLTITARASDTPEVSDTFYVTVDQSNPWVHDEVVLTVVRGNYYSDAVPEVTVSPTGAASYLNYDAGKFTYLINANSGKITFTVELPEEGAKATVSVNVSTVGDWTNEQKAEQQSKLNGNILPFTPARWNTEDAGDNYFEVTTTDVTVADVENTFDKDSKYVFEGSTAQGIDVYSYDDKYGVVFVGIYSIEAGEGEDYDTTVVMSYFEQHAWNADDIKILNSKLYGLNLPHPLGEWHLEVSEYDGSVVAKTQDSRITLNDVVNAFANNHTYGDYLLKKQPGTDRYAFTLDVGGLYFNGYIFVSDGLPCYVVTIGRSPVLDTTVTVSADVATLRGGDVATVTVTTGSYYAGDTITLIPSLDGFVEIEELGDGQFAVTAISEDQGLVDLQVYINDEPTGEFVTISILAYDWLDEEKAIMADFFTEVTNYEIPCFGLGWTLGLDEDTLVAQADVTGKYATVYSMLAASSNDMVAYDYNEGLAYLLANGGVYYFTISEDDTSTKVVVEYVANNLGWTDAENELFETYFAGLVPLFVEGVYAGWEYLPGYGLVNEVLNISALGLASAYYQAGYDVYNGQYAGTYNVVIADTFEYEYDIDIYPVSNAGCLMVASINPHNTYPIDLVEYGLQYLLQDDTYEPVIPDLSWEGAFMGGTIYTNTVVVEVHLPADADMNEVWAAWGAELEAADYFYYQAYDVYFSPDFNFYVYFNVLDAEANTFMVVYIPY